MKVFVENPRFIMREFQLNDAPGLFEMESDPLVHTYLGNKPFQSIKQVEDSINAVREQYQSNGIGRWIVEDRQTGEIMGWSGLKLETRIRDFNYNDIGYRFKPKFWGKGIATETAIAAIRYGFENLGLETICGAADAENLASCRVLTKCGLSFQETFLYTDVLCNWYKVDRETWLARGF
ncbi:MAG: GNAT family N-acetyltransferase [Bacteroidia bacterium]|nr:GNAT family N-acetyltransferase [Bacteroidia bacterium]